MDGTLVIGVACCIIFRCSMGSYVRCLALFHSYIVIREIPLLQAIGDVKREGGVLGKGEGGARKEREAAQVGGREKLGERRISGIADMEWSGEVC